MDVRLPGDWGAKVKIVSDAESTTFPPEENLKTEVRPPFPSVARSQQPGFNDADHLCSNL